MKKEDKEDAEPFCTYQLSWCEDEGGATNKQKMTRQSKYETIKIYACFSFVSSSLKRKYISTTRL